MKREKIINYMILTIASLFFFTSFFTGGFFQSSYKFVIYGTALLLVFLLLLKKKKQIKFGKTDFLLILFSLSYFIPVLFQTNIQKPMFSIQNIFILLGNWAIVKITYETWKKEKETAFIPTLISIATLFVILSILSIAYPIIAKIEYKDYFPTSIGRLYGPFNYPNAFALFLTIFVILSLFYFLKTKEKRFLCCYFLLQLGVTLTISKSILILNVLGHIILFLYYHKVEKEKRNQIFQITLSSILPLAFLNNQFRIYYFDTNLIKYLIVLIVASIIFYFFYSITKKQIGNWIVGLLLIFMFLNPYEKELVLRNAKTQKSFILTDIVHMKKNHPYKIKFEVNGVDRKTTTWIRLMRLKVDENGYEELKSVDYKTIKVGANEIEFDFITEEEFEYYYLFFANINYDTKYRVSSVQVIDQITKEKVTYPLDYAILPYTYLFQGETKKTDKGSINGRFEIYSDCFEIMKHHLLTGQGSKTLSYYTLHENYPHRANDEHSYLLKVLVEVGILPLILLVMIVLRELLFLRSIKVKEEKTILVILFFTLLISGIVDLTISYQILYMLLIGVCFVIEDTYHKSEKKKVMFVASAGGHLTELLMVKDLWKNYDSILVTEKNQVSKELKVDIPTKYLIYCSRFYPVQYVLKETINVVKSFYYILCYNPDLIYTTGAHTGVWLSYFAYLFDRKIIFVEVYDRITIPTISGRMVYPIATTFFVQHEELLKSYKKAKVVKGVYE